MSTSDEKLDQILREMTSLRKRLEALESKTTSHSGYVPGFIEERSTRPERTTSQAPASKFETPSRNESGESMEKTFGVQYLSKIGMVGLLLGISFFLKYSFDNNWVGPMGRILIGYVVGLVILGVGEYYRHKFADWSRVFTGGGLAVLYFSTFAAQNFYDLLSLSATIMIMTAITVLAGFLAVRYNSIVVALFGIIGGFLTPLLIGERNANFELFRLLYVNVLVVGVLGISYFKRWSILTFFSFLLTIAYCGSLYENVPREPMMFFLTMYFLLFSVCTFFFAKKEDTNDLPNYIKPDTATHVIFILTNAVVYFTFMHALLRAYGQDAQSLFALLLAGVYLGQYGISHALGNLKEHYFPTCLLAVCLSFVAIAAFLGFDEWHITVTWSIYAVGLVFAGFYAKNYTVRTLGIFFFILAFLRLFMVDTSYSSFGMTNPILNHQFLLYVLLSVCAYVIAYAYKKYDTVRRADEGVVAYLALTVANIITVYGASVECWKFVEGDKQTQQTVLSAFWSLYAMASVIIGFFLRNKWVRIFGLSLFVLAIVKITFVDLFQLELIYRFIGFILLGSVLIFASYLYQKYGDRLEKLID